MDTNKPITVVLTNDTLLSWLPISTGRQFQIRAGEWEMAPYGLIWSRPYNTGGYQRNLIPWHNILFLEQDT